MARKPVSYLASSVLLGTAIGAVVGLLSAPRSGSDLRKTLRDRAGDARRQVEEAGRALPDRLKALRRKPEEAPGTTRVTVDPPPSIGDEEERS